MAHGSIRRIGEILCDLGYTDPAQIEEALRRQSETDPAMSPAPLGEILVEMGAVSDDQVREALAIQGKDVPQHVAD
ncbi:MAG: hypothetical protein GEU28_04995 [Dehalococcoidia bacterium]|nr:hypothetical protein [Dehalococcoidia bacterium]